MTNAEIITIVSISLTFIISFFGLIYSRRTYIMNKNEALFHQRKKIANMMLKKIEQYRDLILDKKAYDVAVEMTKKKDLLSIVQEMNNGLYEGLRSLEPFVKDKKRFNSTLQKSKERKLKFLYKGKEVYEADAGNKILIVMECHIALCKSLDSEIDFLDNEISNHTDSLRIGIK